MYTNKQKSQILPRRNNRNEKITLSNSAQVVPPWFTEQSHSLPSEHHHDQQPSIPSSIASASSYSSHQQPELIYTSPPKGHISEYIHGGPPLFENQPQDWELSGPGLGSE